MKLPYYPLRKIISTLCLCGLLYTPAVFGGAYQSHESIYQAARSYARSHVVPKHAQKPEIKISKLDSRLKLKKCSNRLKAFLPKGGRKIGKTTIGIKCTGSNPWSLHVPLTISVYGKVLVASRQLQKNSVLKKTDIKLARYNLAELPFGYFESLDKGVGMKLKRRVTEGTVLTPAMLKKPRIVKRGQKVSIMAQSGSMVVRMQGKALDNGAAGDRIKVMNVKSRKKLEGVVTLSGEVKVDI
ncbi:MAG TPA: flagellar basal body P-ring formation protein FlgA [Gammaproteobacteria bacterium]|nr:flagellar basal body P-ring formation protein FlgA [Gammaproteobacteria bacterium]